MIISNQTKQTTIATNVRMADNILSRMTGLLNRSSIERDEALIIRPCNQIHMFFMKFAIDVIFTDRQGCVVGLVEHIKPFHMSRMYGKAYQAIELPSGIIVQTQTVVGDQIIIK